MNIILTIYFFIIGIVFGSFFNVIGMRVPQQKFLESQRSYCPNCKHTLTWYELIPIVSYIVQAGKCRKCKKKISPIYPLIELCTGILFAYSYYTFGYQLEMITALLLVSLLIIVVVSDLRYMLVPNTILLVFLPLFISMRILVPLDPWYDPIIGAVLGYVLLACIIILSRGGMGAGDMKLMAVLGVVLGWEGVLLTFFLASLYGTIISGILLIFHVVERTKAIPFVPFIAMGALTTYFWGNDLINWYVHNFF